MGDDPYQQLLRQGNRMKYRKSGEFPRSSEVVAEGYLRVQQESTSS